MEDVYFNVREPGSYGGITSLYRQMRQKDRKITVKQVREWLAEQESYGLHKPVRRRFKRRKIYAHGIDYLWQADLVDMTHLADDNDGFRYLLTVIDVFSKYAWVVPLKRKDSRSITDAFEHIFAERRPLKLQTDKGKEFVNSVLQKMLRERGVKFFTSQNEDIKASIAERFNRTLKTKMWRYFTHKSTNKFIDILPDMVHSYNNTYHRTIGRTPASVTAADVEAVRERMYGDEGLSAQHPLPSLNVGDKVRISKTRQAFGKGYLPNWTGELFTVVEVLPTSPPTYRLQDYLKESIQGSFYGKELQRVVKNDDVYKIEKILKSRRRHGSKEYFVKWLHYPDSFNSWVKESDMRNAI
jgi:transposase InsO family protein